MRSQWTQSSPPTAIWTAAQLAYHCAIDADLAATSDEQNYLADLQAAAVEFAETAMGCSLLTRTITAVFYSGPHAPAYTNIVSDQGPRLIELPRGPIHAITSATDSQGNAIAWQADGAANTDLIRLTAGYTPPLTVVYTAGYGAGATDPPADLRHAIRAHVAFSARAARGGRRS